MEQYGYRPKVTQSPAILTNTVQGTSAFVVPAKRTITKVSDTNKGAVEGRAPLQLTPALDEETEKLVGTGILTPESLLEMETLQ